MKIAFVVLDAVRKDYLGPFGGDSEISPVINELAERGLTFTNCIAGAPWTPASHATMFTGQYPSSHNVRADNLAYPKNGHYLSETLQECGVTTQGIGAEPWLSRRQGFDRGFDRFHDTGGHSWRHYLQLLPAGVGYAKDKLRCRVGTDDGSDRFDIHLFRQWARQNESFTFMNIPVAHAPYHPPARFRQKFGIQEHPESTFVADQPFPRVNSNEIDPTESEMETLRQRYAAGVAHADYLLGRAIDTLDDDTWIVITADHGDLLGESNLVGHQFSLRDELINVPLIISHPSLESQRVNKLVHHVDIAPTLYDIATRTGYSVDFPNSLPGYSLLKFVEGELDKDSDAVQAWDKSTPLKSGQQSSSLVHHNLDYNRVVFAEYGPPVVATNTLINNGMTVNKETIEKRFVGLQAAVTTEFKLYRKDSGERCLVRRADETVDITDDYPQIANQLSAALDHELGQLPSVDLSNLDGYVESSVEDRLKQLGYA